MQKDTNQQDSVINVKEPLLSPDTNTLRKSTSIVRRTTFIPTIESDYSEDEKLLKLMGFDEGMIKKVYLFLKPNNIEEAIEIMMEVNEIYQHDYYEGRSSSINGRCYICKQDRQHHRNYVHSEYVQEEKPRDSTSLFDMLFIKENNKTDNEKQNICMNEINEDEEPIASISEKTECLICLEGFEESNGTKLPCGHFCCENCLFNYLKTEIESAKVAKIKCFIKDCEYTISEAFILSKLSNDHNLTDKYKIFKQRAEIFLSKDKKFCPEQDCNSYLKQEKKKYVQCENGHKYCYVCLKPWHGSEPCDEELDKDFQI